MATDWSLQRPYLVARVGRIDLVPQEERFELVRLARRRKARGGYQGGAADRLIAAVPAIELDPELLVERPGVKRRLAANASAIRSRVTP